MIFGLPLHPLVVHFAVVLIPLGASALGVVFLVPRWRSGYLPLATAISVAGALAGGISKATGHLLAADLGLPAAHERWGNLTVAASTLLAATAIIWTVQHRRALRNAAPGGGEAARPAAGIWGVATLVLAVVSIAFAVLTGHSGAQAAWGDRVPTDSGLPAATPAPTQTSGTREPSPTRQTTGPASNSATQSPAASQAPAPDSYPMAEVARHSDPSSCWAVVDGGVYDLTDWIDRHPGGPQRIEALCGTDATTAFRAQHDNQAEPNSELAGFRIGTLE